jgi:hypothetical protein
MFRVAFDGDAPHLIGAGYVRGADRDVLLEENPEPVRDVLLSAVIVNIYDHTSYSTGRDVRMPRRWVFAENHIPSQ